MINRIRQAVTPTEPLEFLFFISSPPLKSFPRIDSRPIDHDDFVKRFNTRQFIKVNNYCVIAVHPHANRPTCNGTPTRYILIWFIILFKWDVMKLCFQVTKNLIRNSVLLIPWFNDLVAYYIFQCVLYSTCH